MNPPSWSIAAVLLACAASARAQEYYPPPESQGGWRSLVTTNETPTAARKADVQKIAGLNWDRLLDAWTYLQSVANGNSLVVIRHGWIAGEWSSGYDRALNSGSKSLTGLALAKVIEMSDAGQLARTVGYEDFAYKYLPESWGDADPKRKLIKVKHLLTMCSGLKPWDGPGKIDILTLPVEHPPETVWEYTSAGIQLVARIIENVTGQRFGDFLKEKIATPAGVESISFHPDSSWSTAGGGIKLATRDYARIGYLMLHRGTWNTTPLVRDSYVDSCRQWPTFLGAVTPGPRENKDWFAPAATSRPYTTSSNTWWLNGSPSWPSSVRPIWPSVPRDAFLASGFGKVCCLVIPSLDMVIAHQNARATWGARNAIPEYYPTLFSRVMAAVTETNPPSSGTVERWDAHETPLTATGSYANPFQDVDLTAVFTHGTSGTRVTVDGFHDGESTWRVRFMPTQLGTWSWATQSRDAGLDAKTGTFECVAPRKGYLRGPLRAQGHHFVHADGTPRFLISTRLSCQFAPPSVWPPLTAFLRENRINRVLFMMPGVGSDKDKVHNPRYLFAAGPDVTRYNLDAFRAIDAFVDALRREDILASPYFFYDPQRLLLWNLTPEQDRAYIRYGMARMGAYGNVMPVLANEVELKKVGFKDRAYDLRSHAWANEMGAYLKGRTVFGQAVTVHNPMWQEFATQPSYFTLLKEWPFADWADYVMKQAQVGSMGTAGAMADHVAQPKAPTYTERAYARHNELLVDLRRFGKPVINEEPGYDYGGTASAWNSQTPERMRRTFWTAAAAGAYSLWGSTATYETGDPLPKMKKSPTVAYLRVLHDVMSGLPYGDMEPQNGCVTPGNVDVGGKEWRTNFALARAGEAALVYSIGGGSGTVTLGPGRYAAARIDPRDGARTELGEVDGGSVKFSLPPDDWVLVYRRPR